MDTATPSRMPAPAPLPKRRHKSLLHSLLSSSSSSSSSSLSPEPTAHPKIPGLHVAENAFSAEQELELLEFVDASAAPWTQRRTRRTKNYGPYYYYTERDTPEGRFRYTDGVVQNTPLPPFLYSHILPIVVRNFPFLSEFSPNQLHVALYETPAKIHMHNDNKMGAIGDYIIGLCCLSDCTMTFVNPVSNKKRLVSLPRLSAYVMSGDSHRVWRHGILSGDTDGTHRVSFTLRQVIKLKIEEQGVGLHVKKSAHAPTPEHIELQRRKDAARLARKQQRDAQPMLPATENSSATSNDAQPVQQQQQQPAIRLVDLIKS